MLPQNLSPFSRSLPLGEGVGQIGKAPSQCALERRVVMKGAIDFFADFKEEAFSCRLFCGFLVWGLLLARPVGFRGIQRGGGRSEEAESSRMVIVGRVCVSRKRSGGVFEDQEVLGGGGGQELN